MQEFKSHGESTVDTKEKTNSKYHTPAMNSPVNTLQMNSPVQIIENEDLTELQLEQANYELL